MKNGVYSLAFNENLFALISYNNAKIFLNWTKKYKDFLLKTSEEVIRTRLLPSGPCWSSHASLNLSS